jgi:hypothetical protein
MRLGNLLPLTYIALLPAMLAQVAPGGDGNWPKEIDSASLHMVI